MLQVHHWGFFRELPYGDQDGPSLAALVSQTPQPNEAEIVSYLRAGICLAACGAENADIFAPERRLPSMGVLTDGVWVWPSDMAYYVEVYHCPIPAGFLLHMMSTDWRPPDRTTFDIRGFCTKYRQAYCREVVRPTAEPGAAADVGAIGAIQSQPLSRPQRR
jgi:hypothetical protein